MFSFVLQNEILRPPIKLSNRYASSQIYTVSKTKLLYCFRRSGLLLDQNSRTSKKSTLPGKVQFSHKLNFAGQSTTFQKYELHRAESTCATRAGCFDELLTFVYLGSLTRDLAREVRMSRRSLLEPLKRCCFQKHNNNFGYWYCLLALFTIILLSYYIIILLSYYIIILLYYYIIILLSAAVP